MKKFIILIILVFFMIFTISGQIIESSDKPLKGEWDLKLKEVWGVEGTGVEFFGKIQNVEVSEDGRVYVLDSKLKTIFIFDKDGKFVSKFGKVGEGPGEFKTFNMGKQLFVLKKDLIYVEPGRLHYFTLDGKFKKTIKTPASITTRGFISRDVLISVPRIIGISNKKKTRKIRSYNLITKKETIISTFIPYDKASSSKEGNGTRTMYAIIIASITPRMTVGYKDGILYYGMSDNYRITKKNLKNGDESTYILNGRKQKKVSRDFLNELAKDLKQIPSDIIKKILDGLPEKASFFVGINAQDNGLVYVFVSDPNSRSKQAIDVFSPEGKHIYSTSIDIGKDKVLRTINFSRNNLLISFEDEEGEVKLTKYQINHPDK